MVKPFIENWTVTDLGITSQAIPVEPETESQAALSLLLNYTLGDEKNTDVILEMTPDFSDILWYQYSGMALSGITICAPGVIRFSSTQNLLIPLFPGSGGYLRINAFSSLAGANPGVLSAYLLYGRS